MIKMKLKCINCGEELKPCNDKEIIECQKRIIVWRGSEVNENKVVFTNQIEEIKARFKDKYLLLLSISDHINEVQDLYLHDYKRTKDRTELDKELIDLYILLTIYCDDKQELIDSRVDRFIEKMRKDN